jgi:hypothetical protein
LGLEQIGRLAELGHGVVDLSRLHSQLGIADARGRLVRIEFEDLLQRSQRLGKPASLLVEQDSLLQLLDGI